METKKEISEEIKEGAKELGVDPKKLGVKIVPESAAAWVDIRKGAEKDIENAQRGIILNQAIIREATKMEKLELKKAEELTKRKKGTPTYTG